MNWFDLAPPHIAERQIAWERMQRIRRVYEAGMSMKNIAHHIGRSRGRVKQLVSQARRLRTSPVEKWLKHSGEICELYTKLQSALK
jgi:hypothetical protein